MTRQEIMDRLTAIEDAKDILRNIDHWTADQELHFYQLIREDMSLREQLKSL